MNLKLIFRIARTELATLFYSPIAWLLLIAFACQVGMDFCNILTEVVKIKALGNQITFSVTAGVVLGMMGLYEVIQGTLYLYIPLLTMNLMSREYASGSIKLLYSSPVSSIHIVGGKFLAMVVCSILFVIILALPVVTMALAIPQVDYALIGAGLLSMFLLILCYCAIGLFMSVLTSYQVVAAVATLSALAFLNYIGEIGQASLLVRDITYWFSLKGRASEMVGGLICSDDIVYFISVIALFLALSVIKINNEKTRYSLFVKVLRYVSVVACVAVVGYVSSRPAMMSFYDATHAKQRTLSQESQDMMRQLEGPLSITTYIDIFDPEFDVASPKQQKSDYERFKMYTRFKPEIEMNYVYYYSVPRDSTLYKQYPGLTLREIAVEVARKKRFNPRKLVSSESLRNKIDLRKEEYRFVRVVERANGAQSRLRLFDDMEAHPSEREISAALKKLIVKPIKVGAVVGHNERSISRKGDQDYSIFATRGRFRYSMINQGFDLADINLNEITDVPDSIQILLIAEMRTPASEQEMQVLKRYISRGGNLMIIGDVGRQAVMNPVLKPLGVEIVDGVLVQPSEEYLHSLVLSRATQVAADSLGGFFKRMMRNPAINAVTMPKSVALKVVDTTIFHPIVLLQTDSLQTWVERQQSDFTDKAPQLDTLAGEKLGAYPTALALTRSVANKEQRIIVLGDADCFSNSELMIGQRAGIVSNNFTMIPGLFRWLCYNEFPVSSSREPNRDTDITLSPMDLPIVKFVYYLLIPLLIGGAYLVVWLHRRRN